MERSRSVPIPLSQSRSVPFTLQPNKKQNRSVPDYQTQNRAAPFLESGMERLRSTWLLNQTLPKTVAGGVQTQRNARSTSTPPLPRRQGDALSGQRPPDARRCRSPLCLWKATKRCCSCSSRRRPIFACMAMDTFHCRVDGAARRM
jgi:hypothetical protein